MCDICIVEMMVEWFVVMVDMVMNLMLFYVVEVVMMGLLYVKIVLGDDDDDLICEKFVIWVVGEVFGIVIGVLFFVCDGWFVFFDFGDGGGVLGLVMEIFVQVWKQVVQGENDWGLWCVVVDVVGVVMGFLMMVVFWLIEEIVKGSDGLLIEVLMGCNLLVD